MQCNVFQKVVENMCKKVLTKKLTIEKKQNWFYGVHTLCFSGIGCLWIVTPNILY